jgi:hypothetical protein
VLLDQRNLGLHCQLDVRQRTWRGTRSDAGQDPCRAFLIHQPARAVDRIDDDHPPRRGAIRPVRHHDLTVLQPLGDEHHRRVVRRHRSSDLFDEQVFRDAIDGVDRVPLALARNGRQPSHGRLFAGPDHITPDASMQGLDRSEKRMLGSHVDVER